ncbi:MAG TPA: FAD-dependent oxidoreductase [Drouetiella sp.]|jgi:NADPH-dependent 2,4-dienoyl-CoA reductase/sulfur reductase-like enzyme/rhodanese-related sulfurtransferase
MSADNLTKEAKKIVIIGGVAGGMSAAARARRISEESEILVFESGAHVSFANCGLPYFLGGEIESIDKLLVVKQEDLRRKLNLDIRVNSEVIAISTTGKTVEVRDVKNSRTYTESYDDLILAVGAAPIKPKIPGIDLPGLFSLRSLDDVTAIEEWVNRHNPRTVVIAGGGFIGLETAEQYANKGMSVTLIDGQNHVLAPLDFEMATLVHEELQKHKVRLVLGSTISAFHTPEHVACTDAAPKSCWVEAGSAEPIAADMVILGLGVRPESSLARNAGLQIGPRGGVKVDAHLQTSSPNVWAVGDVIEVRQPISDTETLIALGGPANRQGRIAVDNIFGKNEKYEGTYGTAILRVFELTVATVGQKEQTLRELKIPCESVYVHPSHHAGYYPGAERLDMKVLFHPVSGRLLGAQIIGKQGVDKRIDIIATAIKANMTVRDLAQLELAYAPPFGSAKDPINLAGMVGTNVLDGFLTQIGWQQAFRAVNDSEVCFIDVRTEAERARGYIAESIHIPIPELRERISEIPAGKKIITYCQSGQRSYLAYRILKQAGFDVRNLSGGFLTWKAAYLETAFQKALRHTDSLTFNRERKQTEVDS